MPKQIYTGGDVLEAARERVAYLFNEFDHVTVSISGGKDSTVLTHIVLETAESLGRRVGIFFLDEEVVYDSSIEQVKYLMGLKPEITDKYWLQVPFHLTNALSIFDSQLIPWDPEREDVWMRPKEDGSIHTPPWDPRTVRIANKTKGFGFYDALFAFEECFTKSAFLIGLRGTESPNRWGASAYNPGFKNIAWSTSKGKNFLFYPLYDWNTGDVWKYISDNNLRYSRIYDMQCSRNTPVSEMRVSSLIHERSFKSLTELNEYEPDTFNRLLKRAGGIRVGSLYGKDALMVTAGVLPKSFSTWREYRDYLLDSYAGEHKEVFIKRFNHQKDNEYTAHHQCRQLIQNDYENNKPVKREKQKKREKLIKWKNLL